MKSAGLKNICYFSAGSYEEWRPDKDRFDPVDIGKPLEGWPGETWLDVSSAKVRRIMADRLALAQAKGCDVVGRDNFDGFQTNGLGLMEANAIDFVKFLADETHVRGMALGLKNALSIITHDVRDVDFAVNEQCVENAEHEDAVHRQRQTRFRHRVPSR